MALQLWETLKESIVAYTGLSPAAFFTLLALGLTLYYVVSGLFGSLSDHQQRPRDYQQQMQPLAPPVPLVETSEDEIKQYDGTDHKKSLLMANKGQIYDVSQSRRSYDVFLSFRGPDVRNHFVGHLYTALDQRGMNTYFDCEELKKGEQISPALMEAIKESRIAIIVFSKNYASSTWCLNELAKIMECKKQRDLIVFPVFYKMEPREVKTPRNDQSYGQALAKHEVKFENDLEKVKRWKEALYDAGSLFGHHVPENGYEPRLIQDIIRDISIRLDRMPLDVAKYPVGIDSQVQVLKTILNLQSEDKVLMVGLWGKGGVGKTTLAKAIYNDVFERFEGSSFLEHVRENSDDLIHLQKKLLSEVLSEKKLRIYNVSGGSRLIQDRLCNKKVLIILDDVDDKCQLDALARCYEWFGKGSRIIFTTRNRHLLTSHGVDWNHMYEVKALENGEALDLFRKHAFLGNKKIEIRSDLVDGVVHYAKGLPLALEVLGSFLCGRGEKEWESTLQKLATSPYKKINDVLKVSFDGLEHEEKEIFLDIACFFNGQSTEHITKVLESCGFAVIIGVQILIERSLISEEKGTLQMHDLIQLMGMNIVKEECRDNPRKRSRLWLWDDFLHVLSGNAGMDAIKAIILKLPKREEMYIGPNTFTHMINLRLLILLNVDNSFQGPIHLPNELRWFEWPHCTSLPEFSDGPKKLVQLHMLNSKIELGLEQFKDFRMLKDINFGHCKLTCVPDVSSAPCLESLDLYGCKSLVEVHQSVGCLDKLEVLVLSGCTNLSIFPSTLKTRSLRELYLNGCRKLKKFPDILAKIEHLEYLRLEGTAIEELPTSIDNLVSVTDIDLTGCENLVTLPLSIFKLQNLWYLTLTDCSNFATFPMNLEESTDPHGSLGFPKLSLLYLNGCNKLDLEFLKDSSRFPQLTTLDLSMTKFTHMPTYISKYDNLKYLIF